MSDWGAGPSAAEQSKEGGDTMLYHMRLVATSLDGLPIKQTAIDVVIRGNDQESVEAAIEKLRRYLEWDGDIGGSWAGVGRGEYREEVKLA